MRRYGDCHLQPTDRPTDLSRGDGLPRLLLDPPGRIPRRASSAPAVVLVPPGVCLTKGVSGGSSVRLGGREPVAETLTSGPRQAAVRAPQLIGREARWSRYCAVGGASAANRLAAVIVRRARCGRPGTAWTRCWQRRSDFAVVLPEQSGKARPARRTALPAARTPGPDGSPVLMAHGHDATVRADTRVDAPRAQPLRGCLAKGDRSRWTAAVVVP